MEGRQEHELGDQVFAAEAITKKRCVIEYFNYDHHDHHDHHDHLPQRSFNFHLYHCRQVQERQNWVPRQMEGMEPKVIMKAKLPISSSF